MIESAVDDELEHLLTSYVLSVQAREPAKVPSLPIGLQAHFVAYVLHGQVLSGGFNQLMFQAPDIAAMAPDAFIHLEMQVAAVIAQDAWHLYEVVRPSHDAARRKGTLKAFTATYEPPVFEELDLMYADAADDFRRSRISYVRSHPEEFVHP